MMGDRLVVVELRGYHHIQWEIAGGEDMGAILGESSSDGTGPTPKDRGDWEHWVANKLLKEQGVSRNDDGYSFDSHGEAAKALRLIRATISAGREMPEWAKKATQEGWKPPRGWKP